MTKLSITDLSLSNQRILMRVDFNVPLQKDGTIADDSRIRAALPSIRYLLDHGVSQIILMSHLGRPNGKVNPKESLAPCAKRLSELLEMNVIMAPECIGPSVEKILSDAPKGSIILLENLRFHPGEEDPQKEPEFVEKLATLGDLYVNDAFGAAHRNHASTALIAAHFPKKSAMGFLIESELKHLSPLLTSPKRPFHAIIGGAKVSSKAGVLKQLLKKIDALYIGGAMAFPFLKAQSIPIGSSLCNDEDAALAKELLKEAKKQNIQIFLPSDFNAFKENEPPSYFSDGLRDGWKGMDIGKKTLETWKMHLTLAATIFWNGPVGVFETAPFNQGTQELVKFLSHSKASVIVGGGDSVAAIEQFGLTNSFEHVSTGGGASLEFLELGHLPGVDALSDK